MVLFFKVEFIPRTFTERMMTIILAKWCLSAFHVKTVLHAVQDIKASGVILPKI